jgi:hypothetical protein
MGALWRQPPPQPDPVPPAAPPRVVLDPVPQRPTRCADLIEAFKTVAEATLPADIDWTGALPPEEGTDCAGGGLFRLTFDHPSGKSQTLGFEGGEQAAGGQPCDSSRGVAKCEDRGAYRIGHYRNRDDYGVLYGGPGLFFFVGLEDGINPPLTTDQLAMFAEEVARVIFVD